MRPCIQTLNRFSLRSSVSVNTRIANNSLGLGTRTGPSVLSSPMNPKVKLLAADGQAPGDDMRQEGAIVKLPRRRTSRSLGMLEMPSEDSMLDVSSNKIPCHEQIDIVDTF